jgi:hypothetical protein
MMDDLLNTDYEYNPPNRADTSEGNIQRDNIPKQLLQFSGILKTCKSVKISRLIFFTITSFFSYILRHRIRGS